MTSQKLKGKNRTKNNGIFLFVNAKQIESKQKLIEQKID